MTRLEAVARGGGATVSDYAGTRVVSIAEDDVGALAMAVLEPGLVAVGDLATVHQAIDGLSAGSDTRRNEQTMGLLRAVGGCGAARGVGGGGRHGAGGGNPLLWALHQRTAIAGGHGGRWALRGRKMLA